MSERIAKTVQANDAGKKHQKPEPASDSRPYFPGADFAGFTVQRKASCACGGGCSACQTKSNDLKVSSPDDAAEIEADQIADKVMRMPDTGSVRGTPNYASVIPMIQTKSGAGAESSGGAPVGSEISDRINSSLGGGSGLDGGTRSFMESRFGTGLGGVRIHTGSEASALNRDLSAKAFTVGSDIYFNEGQYQPETDRGKHLLAHELAHTFQQNAGAPAPQRMIQRIITDHTDGNYSTHADAQRLVQTPQVLRGSERDLCGRPSGSTKRVSGFTGALTGTYISNIVVTINASSTSSMALTWANGSLSTETLPTSLNFSPGAGNCNTDCSDPCNSNQSGSHCTPVSPPLADYGRSEFVVQGYSCRLRSTPSATFVTWFHYDREIAFHYLDVPAFPASHGCARMEHSANGAEWLYDNTLPNITIVTVNRDASGGPGPKCYRNGVLIARPATAPTGPVGSCAAPAPTPAPTPGTPQTP
jgi:hypothetical protein